MTDKKIDSLKHANTKRTRIPSEEEAGYEQDKFDKWQRGLSDLAKTRTRRKLENTLRIEIDAEAFDRLYGFVSHPIPFRAGRRVAVRVVSQFGEESTKVLRP
jgi:adenine-specific DNA-methyltransferase